MLESIRTLSLFIIAALCEVGGAYLIWQWQRAGKPAPFALLGLAALFIYSLIQTTQAFSFGRTFAAYGGIFILVAMLWGWFVDKQVPDRWDWVGIAVCMVGVAIMLAIPRA